MKHASKEALLLRTDCYETAKILGLRTEKRGSRISVECPFHQKMIGKCDAHLGSAFISPDKRHVYCYACGGKGDAIAMVMADQRIDSFSTAVDWLAERTAPDLLSGTSKNTMSGVSRFPFTDAELKMIGLCTDRTTLLPVGLSYSKKDAMENGRTALAEPDYYLSCESFRYSIRDLFKSDPYVFKKMVLRKTYERIIAVNNAQKSIAPSTDIISELLKADYSEQLIQLKKIYEKAEKVP